MSVLDAKPWSQGWRLKQEENTDGRRGEKRKQQPKGEVKATITRNVGDGALEEEGR